MLLDSVLEQKTSDIEMPFPNPNNPKVNVFNIPVNLEERGLIQMMVWDVLGSRICKLEPRMLDEGLQIIEWDGRNDDGEYVASGTYFYRIWSSRSRREGRLTLIR